MADDRGEAALKRGWFEEVAGRFPVHRRTAAAALGGLAYRNGLWLTAGQGLLLRFAG